MCVCEGAGYKLCVCVCVRGCVTSGVYNNLFCTHTQIRYRDWQRIMSAHKLHIKSITELDKLSHQTRENKAFYIKDTLVLIDRVTWQSFIV